MNFAVQYNLENLQPTLKRAVIMFAKLRYRASKNYVGGNHHQPIRKIGWPPRCGGGGPPPQDVRVDALTTTTAST
jgi:hypothetical protein